MLLINKVILLTMVLHILPASGMLPRNNEGEESDSFGTGALTRVVTSVCALGAGSCVEESSLPELAKVPLFAAACLFGTYGFDWHQPQPALTTKSQLCTLLSSTITLSTSWIFIKQTTLSERSKVRVMALLFGFNIWRFYKATHTHEQ